MKERPILFSSDMVNAILHGTANTKTKTQTRRTKGLEPFNADPNCNWTYAGIQAEPDFKYYCFLGDMAVHYKFCCPYGEVGDRLWVKETFARYDGDFKYKADFDWSHLNLDHGWNPSIHMPREASRITLEIQDIRVQRLLEISDADAIAEGIVARNYSAKEAYLELWDKILGNYAHRMNPFVWVIEFKRLEGEK